MNWLLEGLSKKAEIALLLCEGIKRKDLKLISFCIKYFYNFVNVHYMHHKISKGKPKEIGNQF